MSQQYNITFQQYWIPAVVFGCAFSIIILLIIECIKCICCRRKKWSQGGLTTYEEKWKKIEYLSKKVDTRPLSIINACSLLDHALKTKGYQCETIGERLACAHTILSNYNQISKVIRQRNQLAHEFTMEQLTKEEVKHALKIIRQALFDLNAYV